MDSYHNLFEFAEPGRAEIRPTQSPGEFGILRGLAWGAVFSIPLWILAIGIIWKIFN